ncbi:MAG TPA: PAS domain-containing protein [Polyangiales bacterium]|nr:PAS domain-containing protein [Polyangiales bacterium]
MERELETVERELQEARTRFELALIAGEVGTFVWEVGSDRVYGDRNFAVLFGVAGPEVVAPLADFMAAIHPDDREATAAAIQRTLETGADYRTEYRIVSGDTTRWVSARGRLEARTDDKPRRFAGVLLDITERKQAEQAQQRLAERYAHHTRLFDGIASTTPDFIYIFDLSGHFLYANRRLLEVWGKTFDEAIGRSLYELGYPDWHAEMHLREIAQVIATKKPIQGTVPFTGGSGIHGIYEYIFTPVLGKRGEVEVIAGTTRDVTERNRTETALREGREALEIALMASETGTFRYDLIHGELVGFDDGLRRLVGLGPDEKLDREDLLARIHAEDLPAVTAAIARTVHEAVDFELELRVVLPNEGTRWLFARAKVVSDEAGKPRHVVGACTDITRRRQSELAREALLEAERKAREEAELASRLKDEFLATLSHELRTPLNAILGWSQILRRRSSEDERLREGFGIIERNARVQVQLIEDLLDMSRIVAGKLRLDVQPVDLREVIRAALESVAPAAEARSVRVQTVLDSHAGPVRGDPARLQQIVWNLLANAIKFTPKGGRVTVALERISSHVEISISDSGIGIAPDFLPHVFERFRQSEGGSTRRHQGLGLGLGIVKSLVEMHGGHVRASSAGLGEGANFTVELPLMVTRPSEHPRKLPTRSTWDHEQEHHDDRLLEGVLVLVVDDEPDTRELLAHVLAECSARVLTAANAAEAYRLLQVEHPDVLLSDIGMPDEDGYSLIRRVRELPARDGGDTPSIALTAFARSEDRRRALIAGFQSHLAKPVEPAELVAVVASVAGAIPRQVTTT